MWEGPGDEFRLLGNSVPQMFLYGGVFRRPWVHRGKVLVHLGFSKRKYGSSSEGFSAEITALNLDLQKLREAQEQHWELLRLQESSSLQT